MAGERRRGIRLPGRFWVRIAGLETEPQLRDGDISTSGIFFESDKEIGPPGTVERLIISDEEREHSAEVLACLVRSVTVQDMWQTEVPDGLAFEFAEPDRKSREVLEALVRTIAAAAAANQGLQLNDIVSAALSGSKRPRTVESLRGKSLVLETSWAIERGTEVRLSLDPPGDGDAIEVRGVVHQSQAEREDCFRVEVAVGDGARVGPGRSLETALNSLLAGVAGPAERRPRTGPPSLQGSLERVPLPTLLSLLDSERMTGVLSLNAGDQGTEVRVYMVDGRVFDVEGGSGDTPKAQLGAVLRWATGTFRLSAKPHEREDKLQESMSGLILDLLREIDESER